MNKIQIYMPAFTWFHTTLILIIGLCFCMGCDSDNISNPYQDEAFLKYYGGTKNQTGVDIEPYDEGWLLLGSTSSFGYETETFYLLKVDQEGNEEWSLTGNSNSDNEIFGKPSSGFRMEFDGAGGLILLGETTVNLINENGNEETFNKIFIALVNLSTKNLEWSRIIRKEILSNEYPGAINASDLDGYIIVGQTDDVDQLKHNYTTNADLTDFFVNRLDAAGTSLWENIYGFPYNDFAKTIKVENEEYIIMGNSQSQSENASEFVMSKYNDEGGILESKQYGTVSGNINLVDIITFEGESRTMFYGYNTTSGKPIFQVLDANLDAITTIYELESDMTFSNANGIYKTSEFPLEFVMSATVDVVRDNGSEDNNIYLDKIRFEASNPNTGFSGQTFLWGAGQQGQTFGGVGDDIAGKLVSTTDGGVSLIGTTDINTNTMMSLIRTNKNGELQPILSE